MNSAVFTGGFPVIGRAIAELDAYLVGHGDTAAGLIGRAADQLEGYTDQPVDDERWYRFVPPEARPRPTNVAGQGDAMPDMTVFTGERSRAGYRINKLSASLTEAANREAFLADEAAYCGRFGLTEHERQLIADRDWTGVVAAGGNIYVFLKIAATIGSNLIEVGASMRGETVDQFLATRPANQER